MPAERLASFFYSPPRRGSLQILLKSLLSFLKSLLSFLKSLQISPRRLFIIFSRLTKKIC